MPPSWLHYLRSYGFVSYDFNNPSYWLQPFSQRPVLVNIGYLLMRWTNGRWRNTVHRVSEPPRSVSNKTAQDIDSAGEMIPERYSIAFFGFPDAATMVQPFPNCCSDQMPKRWGPLNAGEYLLKKRGVIYSENAYALHYVNSRKSRSSPVQQSRASLVAPFSGHY